MPVELPELVITSKTQSPEVIRQIMKDQGYQDADFAVSDTSDQPVSEPEPEPAAEPEPEPPAAAATPEIPAGAPAGGDDDDDDEEPAPAAAAPAPGQAPAAKKSGTQRLKAKLTAREQELATANAELARLRTQAPTPPAAAAPAPAAAVTPETTPELRAKPKFEDFTDTEDQLSAFNEAMADWKYDQRDFEKAKANREEEVRTAPAREAKAAADAEQQEINRKFFEQATVVRQQHPTFNEEVNAIPSSPVVVATVTRQRDGAELALWLARNPDELEDLNEKTRLPENYTPAQYREAVSTALMELGRVRFMKDRDGMPERPTTGDGAPPNPPAPTPQAQQPPATPVAAAPPAATPPVPARAKPTPVAPVGSRGSSMNLTLKQMSEAQIRAMTADEFRARMERGEMR